MSYAGKLAAARRKIKTFAPYALGTFDLMVANRYCNGVRYWTIVDMMRRDGIDYEAAKRRYDRHRKALFSLFLAK